MKKLNVTVNGVTFEVEVDLLEETHTAQHEAVAPNPMPYQVNSTITQTIPAAKPSPFSSNSPNAKKVNSPMNGKVLGVKVSVGDSVSKGQVVIELEAMKMKTNIYAPADGKVKSIQALVGSLVESGQLLLEYE